MKKNKIGNAAYLIIVFDFLVCQQDKFSCVAFFYIKKDKERFFCSKMTQGGRG